jgi:hypothetical protein
MYSVEGVGVVDPNQNVQRTAIGGQLEALDDVLLLGMRGAEPIEEAVAGLKPDGVDHQGVAAFVMTDRLAEP